MLLVFILVIIKCTADDARFVMLKRPCFCCVPALLLLLLLLQWHARCRAAGGRHCAVHIHTAWRLSSSCTDLTAAGTLGWQLLQQSLLRLRLGLRVGQHCGNHSTAHLRYTWVSSVATLLVQLCSTARQVQIELGHVSLTRQLSTVTADNARVEGLLPSQRSAGFRGCYMVCCSCVQPKLCKLVDRRPWCIL
jgi:hypothetical protein